MNAPSENTCRTCDGEGRTDGNPDITERAPWSFWENLAPGQDLAVRIGLVKPIDCTECNGTGTIAPAATPGPAPEMLNDATGRQLVDDIHKRKRIRDELEKFATDIQAALAVPTGKTDAESKGYDQACRDTLTRVRQILGTAP